MDPYNRSFAILKARFESLLVEISAIYNYSKKLNPKDQHQLNTFNGMIAQLKSIGTEFDRTCDELTVLSDTYPPEPSQVKEGEEDKEDQSKRQSFPAAKDRENITNSRNQRYYVLGVAAQLEIKSTPKSPPQVQGPSLTAADITLVIQQATTTAAAAAVSAANKALLESTLKTDSKVRLPKIDLPSFSGTSLSDWTIYRDTFTTLVYEREGLSNIEKFHFLVGSLSGPALSLIKCIKISEDNFDQAWELLLKHYDSKRKLASSYLNQIINFTQHKGRPTASSLKSFLLTVSESVTAFNNLDIQNKASYILFELAIRNLDATTREAFEIANSKIPFPTFEKLHDFVEQRYLAVALIDEEGSKSDQSNNKLASTISSPNKFQPSSKTKQGNSSKHVFLTNVKSNTNNNNKGSDVNSYHKSSNLKSSKPDNHSSKTNQQKKNPLTCFICKDSHILRKCPTFLKASPNERFNLLKDFPGCRNCLHLFHKTSECKSTYRCFECQGFHSTLLHLPKSSSYNNPSEQSSSPVTIQPSSNTTPSSGITGALMANCDVVLGTISAQIKDNAGQYQSIRLVVDSGSQFSLITESCVSQLGLPVKDFTCDIRGVGPSSSVSTGGKVNCILKPHSKKHPQLLIEAVTVPLITHNLPQSPIPSNIRDQYLKYDLADPDFWKPNKIDLLLGADAFCDIVKGLPVSLSAGTPHLIETSFGHIIIGQLRRQPTTAAPVSLIFTSTEEDLSSIIHKFWETEEVNANYSKLSAEEQQCEDHFESTHHRSPDGRYVLALPFKSGSPPLEFGASKQTALKRFLNLEQKLLKDQNLREDYCQFMTEYLTLGHMSKVPEADPNGYFIPHHAVYKSDLQERKIRVVFDASARTRQGSLNDHVLVGPKLQSDIGDIVLRFRRHRIAFICDIIKMYRQIDIEPSHRIYQQILWRFEPSDEIEVYQLNTVTYGVRSSPYQAIKTIKTLAIDEGKGYPLARPIMEHDIYMDDIASGAPSVEKALEVKSQLINLLSTGGFQLSKWASNCIALLEEPEPTSQNTPIDLSGSSVKILGLGWDPNTDMFSYVISTIAPVFTKRALLSAIGKLYDPLGYLGPIIFLAKCILQETWKSTLGWDDLIPPSLQNIWLSFIEELPLISQIKIPRFLNHDEQSSFQLFGFCDASSKGCCAAFYLLIKQPDHTSCVYLLKSKTRLAPIKTLTIPRLELIASLLLAQLFKSLSQFLDCFNVEKITLFTDSSIVLAWLHSPAYQLKTFVAHRVTKILELVDLTWWRHISTKENPADCGSRGLLPSNLIDHSLWWTGPSWLHLPSDQWPITSITIPSSEIPELKPPASSLLTTDSPPEFLTFIENYSSYLKLVRVTAYIFRYKSNLQTSNPNNRILGPLTVTEFKEANQTLIKLLQQYYYPEAFKTNQNLPSSLRSLNVFLDKQGLLRVGGRLDKAPLPYDHRHPILLPRRSHFTNLIIDYYHRIHLHVGPSSLQAIINRVYWIPSARSVIKARKLRCISCVKFAKRSQPPFMGNLPTSRFSGIRPFHHTGVDFAGPFLCKESSRPKSSITKSYLCLFVCMSTKALHLELVPSLSTEAFINALDRFTSRRGLPSLITSDRGTNFVGTANYLRELGKWLSKATVKDSILNYSSQRNIKWVFAPPLSPHFGALYEAGVKSVKALLRKTLGDQPYVERDLATIFVKIEGILNSRPLCSASTDPDDLEPLTPGHFLIGAAITSVPEDDYSEVPPNRLSHWERMRERVQFFWQRWRNEYLSTLQRRNKWTKRTTNLKVGDLVILNESNLLPHSTWPMGRILEVHPGDDGVVRVVTVRTHNNTYKRPAVKCVSLESAVASEENQLDKPSPDAPNLPLDDRTSEF